MAPLPSVRVIKHFSYKGGDKQFSNRYHFTGGTPADNGHWTTLINHIVTAEMLIYTNTVQMVETIAYDAGSDIPVFTLPDATTGSAALTNSRALPGECAMLARYSTAARSSKNHPIYLFNYYHGAFGQTTTNNEDLNHDQRTLLSTYMNAWITGFSDGTNTYHRAGPNGAVATGDFASPWLTHRDFPT